MQRTPRLRELRERAALSQEDVAARAGVARATIADLEAGKRPARPSTIRKLAKGLDVEVTELYAEPESPKIPAPPSSQERLFDNGVLEEARRAEWDTAVGGARQLRERGRERMQDLLSSWRESKKRRGSPDVRRELRAKMGQLLQEGFDARSALLANLEAGLATRASAASERAGELTPNPGWEEVREADRFYWALREMVEEAGLYIRAGSTRAGEAAQAGQPEVHNVEEPRAA